MTSLRDAHKRLEVIYMATTDAAKDQLDAEKGLDEFQRNKKKIHQEMKKIREALKDRELDLKKGGNTNQAAEASYRIRVMIKGCKECIARMQEFYDKEAKKKKQKEPQKLETYKETLELCKQHVEEVENLEKRRVADANATNRNELMAGTNGGMNYLVNIPKDGNYEVDPYATELPDIDAEEDLKEIRRKDQDIDDQVKDLGKGVGRLKEIALQMGNELDKQQEDLTRLEKNVDKAADHLDNLNVTLKTSVEKVMAGDKFMVNAILLCVILALGAFVITQFVKT